MTYYPPFRPANIYLFISPPVSGCCCCCCRKISISSSCSLDSSGLNGKQFWGKREEECECWLITVRVEMVPRTVITIEIPTLRSRPTVTLATAAAAATTLQRAVMQSSALENAARGGGGFHPTAIFHPALFFLSMNVASPFRKCFLRFSSSDYFFFLFFVFPLRPRYAPVCQHWNRHKYRSESQTDRLCSQRSRSLYQDYSDAW